MKRKGNDVGPNGTQAAMDAIHSIRMARGGRMAPRSNTFIQGQAGEMCMKELAKIHCVPESKRGKR